jgi:hypothetical protein
MQVLEVTPETAWEYSQESDIFMEHNDNGGTELSYRMFILNRPKEVTNENSKVRPCVEIFFLRVCVNVCKPAPSHSFPLDLRLHVMPHLADVLASGHAQGVYECI